LFLFIFEHILDLVPAMSHMYFQEKTPVTLSHAQACVFLYNQNISHIVVTFLGEITQSCDYLAVIPNVLYRQ